MARGEIDYGKTAAGRGRGRLRQSASEVNTGRLNLLRREVPALALAAPENAAADSHTKMSHSYNKQ